MKSSNASIITVYVVLYYNFAVFFVTVDFLETRLGGHLRIKYPNLNICCWQVLQI